MTKNTLRLALVQTLLHWHDRNANLAMFDALLADARKVDLVILPEMFTTGFSMESAQLAEAEGGEAYGWMQTQAVRLDAVVCGSVIVKAADGSYRNRFYWAQPDGQVLHYDKRHLFRMAGEHHHYAAGQSQLTVELHGWRIRPMVCYDLRFPVWSRDPVGTDLLLYTANWPAARRHHWNALLPARAIENLAYVVAVNRIGEDGKGNAYSGDSKVLDFEGQSLLDCASGSGVHVVEIDSLSLAAYRSRFPAHLDRDQFCIQ